jgi:hypothetical protein
VWYNGSGTPLNTLGEDGDYYIDSSSGAYYVKAAGTWSVLGSLKGVQGDVGAAGATGVQGATGAQGPVGSVWLSGTTVPDGGLGSNNDYYIRTTTSDYYKKVPGSWILLGNIQGAQGLTGIQGDTGAQGLQGDTGAQGVTGAQGIQGNLEYETTPSVSYPLSNQHVRLCEVGYTGSYQAMQFISVVDGSGVIKQNGVLTITGSGHESFYNTTGEVGALTDGAYIPVVLVGASTIQVYFNLPPNTSGYKVLYSGFFAKRGVSQTGENYSASSWVEGGAYGGASATPGYLVNVQGMIIKGLLEVQGNVTLGSLNIPAGTASFSASSVNPIILQNQLARILHLNDEGRIAISGGSNISASSGAALRLSGELLDTSGNPALGRPGDWRATRGNSGNYVFDIMPVGLPTGQTKAGNLAITVDGFVYRE